MLKSYILNRGNKRIDPAAMFENKQLTEEDTNSIKNQKKEAWKEYQEPIKDELKEAVSIFTSISQKVNIPEISDWIKDLNQSSMFGIFRRDYLSKARHLLGMIIHEDIPEKEVLREFINKIYSLYFVSFYKFI